MKCGIPLLIEEDAPVRLEIGTNVNIVNGRYQDKTVTPTDTVQIVCADPDYGALHEVTVNPIPSNYGHITWDGQVLTVS